MGRYESVIELCDKVASGTVSMCDCVVDLGVTAEYNRLLKSVYEANPDLSREAAIAKVRAIAEEEQ